jgi:AmiR/NasT family two-component response regulator
MSAQSSLATERNLRVLVADEDRSALDDLGDTLAQLGHEVTPYAVSVGEAVQLIATEEPDLAIVMVHRDDDHALSLIAETVEFASGPVIAHIGDNDVDFIARAAERGISAYVESSSPESVQGAIEVALRRYREAEKLTEKVSQLESALERRVLIERAKGILMERHGIPEREAFEMLRDQARATNRRVLDVAAAVVEGRPLLPPRGAA